LRLALSLCGGDSFQKSLPLIQLINTSDHTIPDYSLVSVMEGFFDKVRLICYIFNL
jgi:hypothetical protein